MSKLEFLKDLELDLNKIANCVCLGEYLRASYCLGDLSGSIRNQIQDLENDCEEEEEEQEDCVAANLIRAYEEVISELKRKMKDAQENQENSPRCQGRC